MACGCGSSQCGCKNVRVPRGPRGLAGASAYQIWLGLGNTGTEADFIEAITGNDGSPGGTGSQIFSGSGAPGGGLGSAGDWYFDNGTPGDITVYQNQGGTWVQVNAITSGDDGAPGTDGDGVVVTSGSGNPSGTPDIPTLYVDDAAQVLWNWNQNTSSWDNLGSIRGDDGGQGPAGNDGYSPQILTGNDAPASGLGNDNDLYLDVANFGRVGIYTKSSGTWTLETTLSGSQQLFGSGAPASGLGWEGDVYWNIADTAAVSIYKKTGPTTWALQFTFTQGAGGGYLFRAEVGADQYLANSTGAQTLNFGDDATLPNYDQGDTWTTFQWTAPSAINNIKFVLNNLTLRRDTASQAVDYTINIIHRSGGTTTTRATAVMQFDVAEQQDSLAVLETALFNVIAGDQVYVTATASVSPTNQFYSTTGSFFNQV